MHVKRLARAPLWVVGCDEAGRGALAGPVVAAAVRFRKKVQLKGLRDSKQLDATTREHFAIQIRRCADWGIGMAEVDEIDRLNVLEASLLAMHRALDQLPAGSFKEIYVDGRHFHAYKEVVYRCFIGGDDRWAVIAAASVLAKTTRDQLMKEQAQTHPAYGWHQNKGYPTPAHRTALRHHGITPLHRQSFRLLPKEMSS